MRVNATLALLCAIAATGLAAPSLDLSRRVIHERRDLSHKRWAKRAEIESDAVVPVRIALRQNNLDNGMDLLMDVSHPDSANYGKHYNPAEIAELFAPSQESFEAVRAWLTGAGVSEDRVTTPSHRGWVGFDASPEELEQIFGTKYHYYEHANGGNQHVGCDRYTLPHEISSHVDYVVPGVMPLATRNPSSIAKRDAPTPGKPISKPFPAGAAAAISADPNAVNNCGTTITPACIKAMYNITDGTKSATGNSLGIFEFGDVYAQQDLNKFFSTYAPTIPSGTKPTAAFVDGATAPTSQAAAGPESDLDFEIAYPIIHPQGTTLYQTDDSQWNFNSRPGLFNNFLDAIDGSYCTYKAFGEKGDSPKVDPVYPAGKQQCGAYKPTNVISLSYGLVEADFPVNYQKRQCNEFMKLGLQGISIVFASGDAGVSDRNGQCLGPKHTVFSPDYPDCPYVTMVGATTLPKGKNPGDPETAVTSFASGGGFSNVFPRPSYQSGPVSAYFASHDPGYKSYNSTNGTIGTNGGLYNKAGRGFPDMAAVGDNGAVVIEGQNTLEGGTSMSAPLVAAIFTRINEERLAAGKSTIGFVNPTLYSHPEMFNDITAGNQAQGGCGTKGFTAVAGWDPVTGMGTPKYDKMLEVFMGLN